MKSNNKYMKWFYTAAVAVTALLMVACEDEPDKYEIAGGSPTIKYVRMPDPLVADSLLTGAYMDNMICLVGNNLRSICELFFNDQKAILNTSYMTDNTILVNVPGNIPSKVTDKIYMVTSSNDTISYDFKVLVPGPQVNSMSCEFAKPGSEVTLYGDYFIDDPNVPLTISMAGNVAVTNITKVTKTAVSFILPQDAPEGYINVKSIYGNGRSKFRYNDKRNILFDWDGSHGGIAIANGWRKGIVKNDNNSLDGGYLYFGGAEIVGEIGGTWAEDQFCFNYWPDVANGSPELSSLTAFDEMITKYGVEGLQMKFEVMIPSSNAWKSAALQMMFTSNADVTMATAGNGYYSSSTLPRGLWLPWKSTGSYDTEGKWTTVSFKLSDFNKTHEGGASAAAFSKENLKGLTFFVWNGGVAGENCNPVICIDNIRVVPIE